MSVIESLERMQLRDDLPEFKAGDTVRVHFRVIEGQRQRVQVFEGTVIKRQGSTSRETFTVRKQSFGVGVERTFPVHSPEDRADRARSWRATCAGRSSTTCAARSARRPASARSSGRRSPPSPSVPVPL